MSSGLETLSLKSDDMLKLLAVNAHTGSENLDYQMEQYVYKRTTSGTHIINLRKTWEKLLLAARAIVAIKNPADVYIISTYAKSQRAILKFASYTGATPIAGRFTPGTFTNQIQKNFKEPLLLIVADPYLDHQPIAEASFVNIPVIAFCNAETPMKFVDIAIPCNNKGIQCVGLMFWMLAREILRFRGLAPRDQPWEVMPDLFFYREPEEVEKDAMLEAEKPRDDEDSAVKAIPDTASLLQSQWNAGGGFGGESHNVPSGAGPMMSPTKGQAPIVEDEWLSHSQPPPAMASQMEINNVIPSRGVPSQYMQNQQAGHPMAPPPHHFEQQPQMGGGPGQQPYMGQSHHMNPSLGPGFREGAAPAMGMQTHHYMQQQHQTNQNYMLPEHLPNPSAGAGMHQQAGRWSGGMPGSGTTGQPEPPLNLSEHKPIESWGQEGW